MEIQFEYPSKNGFTIYSKSGCHNCSKIKKLLTEKHLFFRFFTACCSS